MQITLLSAVLLSTVKLAATRDVARRGSDSPTTFVPVGATLPVVLNGTGALVVLDYGAEVAGTPYFNISAIDSTSIQLEVKYAEMYDALPQPFSDGPYAFASGLSNTFRVETFNITGTGIVTSPLIQGGQRWQSIKQLTPGSLTIAEAGLKASVDINDQDSLPGHFECSNNAYNSIWKLGSRAASAACYNAGTQTATWNLTDEGVYVWGQRPALSGFGGAYIDYTLNFTTKIVRAGVGWSMAGSPGLQLQLVSELPEDSTFVNTNRTVTPANSVVLATGYTLVDQYTLESYWLDSFTVPFDVKEGQWYAISSTLTNATNVSVHINDTLVFNTALEKYGVPLAHGFGPNPAGTGSWGFGGWQDQISIVKDVDVIAQNGSVLYSNTMTNMDVLAEYGVHNNSFAVCMDGAKRDRMAWLGDFFHTTRIIAASSARRDHVLGTFEYFQSWQNEMGLLPTHPPMGYSAKLTPDEEAGNYEGLTDYQVLGLLAFTRYFEVTGDTDFASTLWPGFRRQVAWLTQQVNSTTGLIDFGGFIGSAQGTAVSAATVEALNGAALVAAALNDTTSAQNYTAVASTIARAIDSHLWNPSTGTYATIPSAPNNYSIADIAFAITSGLTANDTNRTASLVSALAALKVQPGYKDTSSTPLTNITNISPNLNGFLLAALMRANATSEAKYLLDNLWTAMIDNNRTTTGASWEYVPSQYAEEHIDPDAVFAGNLGRYTSLSHPWGGAPTYVLTEWVAGIRSVQPGYEKFAIMPAYDDFGPEWAAAKVKALKGELSVRWELEGQLLSVNVTAPEGSNGVFALPGVSELGKWTMNGENGSGGNEIEVGTGVTMITVEV